MATRGGLEIHMELAHAPAPAPMAAPMAPQPVAAMPEGALPRRVVAAPRPPAVEWHMPTFVRGIDPTVPLTALLVLALLVAGVGAALHRGSGGASSIAAVQGGAPAAATPAPATVDAAADQRLGQSFVLTPTDYPDGWTFTPHQSSPSDAADSRADAACLGLPDPATVETADVSGVDASQSQLLQANTEVVVFRTQQQAANDLAAEGGPKAEACARQGLTRALAAEGITVANVGVGRFALSTGNVRSVALHTEIAVAKGAARGVIHADVVFLGQARVQGQAVFLSFGGEFPVDVEQTLVTRFAHKLASA